MNTKELLDRNPINDLTKDYGPVVYKDSRFMLRVKGDFVVMHKVADGLEVLPRAYIFGINTLEASTLTWDSRASLVEKQG